MRLTGSDPRMNEQLAGYVTGLYEEHYAGLFRHLILSGSTAAEADDLIQEGFLRLFPGALGTDGFFVATLEKSE